MTVAHVGGHDQGFPRSLLSSPIRDSSESRGLCCLSCFGPRMCVRGIVLTQGATGTQACSPLYACAIRGRTESAQLSRSIRYGTRYEVGRGLSLANTQTGR